MLKHFVDAKIRNRQHFTLQDITDEVNNILFTEKVKERNQKHDKNQFEFG